MVIVQFMVRPEAIEAVSGARRWLQAGGVPVELVVVSFWQELLTVLKRHPEAVPVVDPYRAGAPELDEIVKLNNGGLSELMLYGEFSGHSIGRVVAELARAGVTRVVTVGIDDRPIQLAHQIQGACGQGVLERLLAGLEKREAFSWKQQVAVQWAIRNGWRACSVGDMAQGVGVRPRTLRVWFDGYDALSPSRLLAWGRVLSACRLISVAGVDPPVAARRLGFSSYSDLCRKYRRLIRQRLPDDDGADLLDRAIGAFLSAAG